MAPHNHSPAEYFTIDVSKSMICTKHQLTLPSAAAKDLGLLKNEHPLLCVTINPKARYWIGFYLQKGAGGGWRTHKSSEWTKLCHKQPIEEGDTLEFTKQNFQDGRYYVMRSARLDSANVAVGYDLNNLFSAPTFYSKCSDDETEEAWWKCSKSNRVKGPVTEKESDQDDYSWLWPAEGSDDAGDGGNEDSEDGGDDGSSEDGGNDGNVGNGRNAGYEVIVMSDSRVMKMTRE